MCWAASETKGQLLLLFWLLCVVVVDVVFAYCDDGMGWDGMGWVGSSGCVIVAEAQRTERRGRGVFVGASVHPSVGGPYARP